MKTRKYNYGGALPPNIHLLENAIRANYVLDADEESEIMEASKAMEGSKSAPQLIMVLFGRRMGFSDNEIQLKFGISDKMMVALWDRIHESLSENNQEFLTKIKLCENYLRLMG